MKKQKVWLMFGLVILVGFALSIGEGAGVDWLSNKLFPNAKPETEL